MNQNGYIYFLRVKTGSYLNPWDEQTYEEGEILRKWVAMHPPWYQPELDPTTRLPVNRCTKEDIPHPWVVDYPTLPPELEIVLVDAQTFPEDDCPACQGMGTIMILLVPVPCSNCGASGKIRTLMKIFKDAFDKKKSILDELDDYEIDASHVNPSPDVPAHCVMKGLKRV